MRVNSLFYILILIVFVCESLAVRPVPQMNDCELSCDIETDHILKIKTKFRRAAFQMGIRLYNFLIEWKIDVDNIENESFDAQEIEVIVQWWKSQLSNQLSDIDYEIALENYNERSEDLTRVMTRANRYPLRVQESYTMIEIFEFLFQETCQTEYIMPKYNLLSGWEQIRWHMKHTLKCEIEWSNYEGDNHLAAMSEEQADFKIQQIKNRY